MATRDLDFDSDVRGRIYRYVERRGAVPREEVRDEVRVPERPDSKPARSGTEPSTKLSVPEFDDHVSALVDAGHLVERDGRLLVSPEGEAETHETDDFAYVVRPATEADREAVADLIRDVADEGAIAVDRGVADAIEREGALLRRNERESRTFFVAETRPESDDDGDGEDADESGEIVGWVHLQGFELPARDHTVELTVGVASGYRERGVGGTLLERGVTWADDRDYLKIYQSLPATNEVALDLLDRYGWTREATRADHYKVGGDLVDEVQLAKRLDD